VSLSSIEHELLTTLRSVDAELRNVKRVQAEQAEAIIQLTQRMQASINSLSIWIADVQQAQRAAAARTLKPLWWLLVLTALALVLFFGLGVALLWQNQKRMEYERVGVPMIVITVTPASEE
jgi:hypothetical protein